MTGTKEVRAVPVPISVSEQSNYQVYHEARVSNQVRTLLMQLDQRIARVIGFEGNILEEISGRTTSVEANGGRINTQGISSSLRSYVDGSRFMFCATDKQGKYLKFNIFCYGGFHLEIAVPTNDGFLEFKVFPRPDVSRFQHMSITRYMHDVEGQFSLAREVNTFEINYKGRRFPDYCLVINDRVPSQRSIEMHYGNIDEKGEVELIDGETVHFADFLGVYSATTGTVTWKMHTKGVQVFDRVKPTVTSGENSLAFEYEGDKFTFPIRTNIYDILRAITSGIDQLPQGEAAQEVGKLTSSA